VTDLSANFYLLSIDSLDSQQVDPIAKPVNIAQIVLRADSKNRLSGHSDSEALP
jgi:hypothetical protein